MDNIPDFCFLRVECLEQMNERMCMYIMFLGYGSKEFTTECMYILSLLFDGTSNGVWKFESWMCTCNIKSQKMLNMFEGCCIATVTFAQDKH